MLVLQGDITQLRFVDSMMLIIVFKYKGRGKELKVSYYASAAAACDGNLPHYDGNMAYIKATCLI